jgi:glycosyltransferase involved in cell wall biosynthesis
MQSRKIKIAFIIDQFGIGGTERQLTYLIEGLDPNQFECSLFLLRGNHKNPLGPVKHRIEMLNIYRLASISGFFKLLKFANVLKKNSFDIIQTFFQDATIFGVLAARIAGTRKILISFRDLLFWATRTKLLVHKYVSLMADYFLVNSNAVNMQVISHFPSRPIKMIHNGITVKGPTFDPSVKRDLCDELELDQNIPIITLVSNCNRRVKRVDLLIEAAAIMLREESATFLIVGDGHLRAELEKRSQQLEVSDSVKFLGTRGDIDRILAGSNIALNTSDSEGFSNSILEAMRAGLPVIASDVTGNRELVIDGKSGYLFRPGNYRDLAEKLVFMIKNPKRATQFGRFGRKLVEEKYSLEQMILTHQDFYHTILNLTDHNSESLIS